MAILENSGNQESHARLEVNDFAKESNMRSTKFWIKYYVKEINLVVTFKDQVEYRDKSK